MIVPVTRKEKLLNAIATNGNVDFSPKTREEIFLFKILGADVSAPTPITRKEILYQHIIDGTIPTFEPRTRLEKFIMVAAGAELELPVVLTREEYWWAEISDSAYETITGAIVHFISKRARAIKSLIANISYTQDLNGYDSPWPAGGGKNLFDESTIYHGYYAPDIIDRMVLDEAYRTCVLTLPAGTYTFSCDMANIYILRYAIGEQNTSVTNEQSTVTFIVPSEAVVKICFRNTGTTAITGTFHTQIESGSTATSYTPYSNICPITGYDNVTLKQSNRNIWAFDASYSPSGYAVLVPRNTEFYLPAGTYTFSAIPDIESSSVVLGGYYADDTQVTLARLNASEERQSATFTIAKPLHKMYLIANKGGTISDLQLELGSTATTYEPYSGNTYDISWQSEAGTVYGGTLDVTSGKLTVDCVKMTRAWGDFGQPTTLTNTVRRTTTLYPVADGSKRADSRSNAAVFLNNSAADTVHYQISRNGDNVNFWLPQDTASDFSVELAYPIATPIEYTLAPQTITTLLGQNYVWADTGDVTVTY